MEEIMVQGLGVCSLQTGQNEDTRGEFDNTYGLQEGSNEVRSHRQHSGNGLAA